VGGVLAAELSAEVLSHRPAHRMTSSAGIAGAARSPWPRDLRGMMAAMARKRSPSKEHTPRAGARWVLFMPTIPAKPASVRVKIWRRLQAIGAVGLRGSVYALPNREECVEVFEWVSRELHELGGQASICEGRFLDDSTDDDIERRFIEARHADYAEIAAAARQLAKRLDTERRTPQQIAQIGDAHARLIHRFGEVTAIDFLHVPGREAVEGLLAAIARARCRATAPGRARRSTSWPGRPARPG
jgi:ChrB-like protein